MPGHTEVLRPEEQARVRVLLVAAGASQLLVVRIERRRRVRMEHPADVRLVDSHPERHSRRDDSRRAVEEGRHRLVPLPCRKPGVVERHPVPGSREHIPRRLRTSVGRRVHDPRAVELRCRALELSMLLLDRMDTARRELDVRTIEVADHHLGLAEPQAPGDLLPHRQGGRRRQGHANRRLERIGLRAETHVVGAEVVTPLADQMRLVDDEEPRPRPPERLPRLRVRQLLRRDEDEGVRIAGSDECGGPRPRRLLRVQHDRGQARRAQMRKLIVLQRDQRRDDHGGPVSQQAGELVDRRLAATGWQNCQDVASFARCRDRTQLPRPQPPEPEPRPGQLANRCFAHCAKLAIPLGERPGSNRSIESSAQSRCSLIALGERRPSLR